MNASRSFSCILLLSFLLLGSYAHAQKTKGQLEKEKRENLKKIAEAEKILSDTEHKKQSSIGQLRAINQQIKARERLIRGLNQEIGLLDGEIGDLSIITEALQSDLDDLKEEYGRMIYASYKANHGFSTLTFLFSAATFNQLFMRMKYLEQYAKARRTQARRIAMVSEELNEQKSQVEIKRSEQKMLLDQQLSENRKLLKLKIRQNSLIAELGKKESQIKKELKDRKVAVDKLDALIADIVRNEVERSKALSSAALASEEEVSLLFEGQKNRMNWPVTTGFVSSKFGKHPHPVIKGIIEDNPGVDIQTNQDAMVRSVFEGKVASVAIIPGMNNVVLIRHGDYYTLYARMKEVKVKKGQGVTRNEPLGTVYSDKDGVSEVHFEIWKGFQKLNPEQWLVSK